MDDANSQPSFTDVLVMRGVRKTYEAEGVPVRALRGADLTLGLGEMPLQDGLRGALPEVGLEHGGEGEATTGPTAALSVSLRRHRRSR